MIIELAGFSINIGMIIRISLMILVGIPVVRIISNFAKKFFDKRLTHHVSTLLRNLIFYTGFGLLIVSVLNELGFNITALLGAAGVFGVAIGFASQTSISNIISGIFLLLERPFSIGDWIKCSDISGIVQSIDLLSVKIRTFDNKSVRIPNEMLVKQRVTNVTFYENQRIDLVIQVDHKQNIDDIKKLILSVIQKDERCLQDPKPAIIVRELTLLDYHKEIRVAIRVRVWTKKKDVFAVRNDLVPAFKQQFDAKGIAFVLSHAN